MKLELPGGGEQGLDGETYDLFAGSDLKGQFLNLKKGAWRDKVYALTEDCKDFLAMLDREIENQLTLRNDPCTRVFGMMAMQSTPEVLSQGVGELAALRDALESMDGAAGSGPKKKAAAKKRPAAKRPAAEPQPGAEG